MTVTEKAYKKLKELQPNPSDVLILSVIGGGCSGLQYNMKWQDYKLPYDKQILVESFNDPIIIGTDNKSALFLEDTELDFTDGLDGKGFIFNNSKAKRVCGCGNSFS